MSKLITQCVCGKCKDRFDMDPVGVEIDGKIVRGLKITNQYTGNAEIVVVPESLALVIEKWIEENTGESE